MRPSLPDRLAAVEALAPYLELLREDIDHWAMALTDNTLKLGALAAGTRIPSWPERVRAEAQRERGRDRDPARASTNGQGAVRR